MHYRRVHGCLVVMPVMQTPAATITLLFARVPPPPHTHTRTRKHPHERLLMPPCPPPPPPMQVMGPPSQAHRLAALPDVVELNAWMLYVQVTAHTAPEAYAKARGMAVEAVLQQEEFHRLWRLRHCDMISTSLAALSSPHCAPHELLGGQAGGQPLASAPCICS